MKLLIAALAGATLMTAPMAADAQMHGGGGWHGGGFHGGGFHGGGFHGGGFHGGGFRGGGFHGGYWGDPFFFGAGLGLGLYAADWGWGYPGYWYDGYPAYYDYGYDDGPDDDRAPPPPPAGGPQANAAAPGAPATCGAWHWDTSAHRYQWVTNAC